MLLLYVMLKDLGDKRKGSLRCSTTELPPKVGRMGFEPMTHGLQGEEILLYTAQIYKV